ncbi:MAG: Gfo/Idh/MocA family oxidoreductase [Leptolyngbyaceae cyanobacterium T60_A2020_046]|nr:Gfo/Idh/MocA family oxidoreductase [Leptolyngbyaceae cyanobacterium T60_A2020_046]
MGNRKQLALFGVGRWGVHLLRNFLALPGVSIAAVVDPRPEQLGQLRDRFNLDPVTQLTDDWQTVLHQPEIDGVVIATPAATHYPLIKTALTQGKHVLAEKPLTLDPAECDALCDLADRQQRQLVIDHTYLFHPAVEAGQRALADRGVGPLRYGYATRTHLGPVRQDVDALWDLAIHDIAIFNHWLGEMPVAVSAQGQTWLQPKSPAIAPDLFPKGLSDVVWVTLYYPSGFRATIHLCWANPDKQRRLCVVGDRGALIFDEMRPQEMLTLQAGTFETVGDRFQPIGLNTTPLAVPAGEPLKQVCQHFLACVETQTPSSRSSGRVGTALVRVLVALSQSLNQGGTRVTVAAPQ